MSVNVSIGDFSPLLRSPEYLFHTLQQTGVDGVELWIGVKSRWAPAYYQRLSRKYNLPITSVHQPLWSMVGWYFDEGFFATAQRLGVQYVTCHPLPYIALRDERMQRYFDRLMCIQEKTGLRILIENMPQEYRNKLLNRTAPLDSQTTDVSEVCRAAVARGLGLTLDTDHVHVVEPQKQVWFNEVFPAIENIHLSNFDGNRRHQPLDKGLLNVSKFIEGLAQRQYSGLITLEISAPKSVTMFRYDANDIKHSVQLVRSVI